MTADNRLGRALTDSESLDVGKRINNRVDAECIHDSRDGSDPTTIRVQGTITEVYHAGRDKGSQSLPTVEVALEKPCTGCPRVKLLGENDQPRTVEALDLEILGRGENGDYFIRPETCHRDSSNNGNSRNST